MVSKSAELAAGKQNIDQGITGTGDSQTQADPLRQQVDAALAGPPKPSDRTKVTDQATAQASGSEPDDPYVHTNRVQLLSRELDTLTTQHKNPEEVIKFGDRQMKVKDLVVEMKQTIKDELEKAKTAAKAINPNAVESLLNSNIQQKNTLARQLGLDPATVTTESLQQERQKAASNPQRRGLIDQLDVCLQERAAVEAIRHAPAYVKLVESEILINGHGRPELKMGDPVPGDDVRKAFDLLKLAGHEDADLKATDIYLNAENRVSLQFASFQQERSQKVIELMTAATAAGNSGQPQTVVVDGQTKTLSQEDLLKEANRLADKIDISWIASQAKLQRNIDSGVSGELLNMVYTAGHARMDYVKYLEGHGRIPEAQTLYNKVRTDTPEMIYDEKGEYRDPSLERLVTKLTLGVSTDGADYQTAQSAFLANIEKGNVYIDRNKPGQSAQENLDQMKALNAKMREEMAEADKVLVQDKQNLVKRQQELQKITEPSESEKIELMRIEGEITVIDNTMTQRHAHLQRRENLTTYMEGCWYEAKEDWSAANAKFKEFDRNEKDPELKKQLDIEGKQNRTQDGFAGWWHRNCGYVAIGASVLVAAGLTVCTLGLGSAAGLGLVATTIAAVGVGTAGAAATHWGIERTVNENAGWDSAWKGAKIGLMTSSMIVAPWASAAAKTAAGGAAVAGGATAAEGAVAVTNIARAASVARTLGITKTSLAAGYGIAAVEGAGDVLIEGKSVKDAAMTAGVKGLFNSAFIGQSMKWGAAPLSATEAVTANAAKQALPKALGITGFNASAGFGTSGVMEYINYRNGTKSGGEAFTDFMKYGAMNTVTLSVIRKYGMADTVGRASSQMAQNMRYAGQSFAMQESFTVAADQLYTRYLMHDLLGQGVRVKDAPMSNLGGLGSAMFGGPLNPYHKGEARRFATNLDYLGNDLNATLFVDPRFVTPSTVSRQGLFFNLDELQGR